MRPIALAITALVLFAGATTPGFLRTRSAPASPRGVWVVYAGDPGNPLVDAARDGLMDGATKLVLNPRFAAYGSAVAGGRGAGEVMKR